VGASGMIAPVTRAVSRLLPGKIMVIFIFLPPASQLTTRLYRKARGCRNNLVLRRSV
jgi:hypothetical protein